MAEVIAQVSNVVGLEFMLDIIFEPMDESKK